MNYKIFYSWQSDSPTDTNHRAIRAEINNVINTMNDKYIDFIVAIDDATRDTTGSPAINNAIFEKIDVCDIFICDITTINKTDSGTRKVPNPNVLIELGYAISVLGWGRVIILFNEAHGIFPEDIPFDIKNNKITKFKITNKDDISGKNSLREVLESSIDAIIYMNPTKAINLRNQSKEEKQRVIDIGNLKMAMSNIDLTALDEFIEGLPHIFHHRIIHYFEGFKGVVTDSQFHIYDDNLSGLINNFYRLWDALLSYSEFYYNSDSGDKYIFTSNMDILNSRQKNAYNEIESLRTQFYSAFKEVTKLIHEKYLEIDLRETTALARKDYIDFYADK